jgi:hypothetical protein
MKVSKPWALGRLGVHIYLQIFSHGCLLNTQEEEEGRGRWRASLMGQKWRISTAGVMKAGSLLRIPSQNGKETAHLITSRCW